MFSLKNDTNRNKPLKEEQMTNPVPGKPILPKAILNNLAGEGSLSDRKWVSISGRDSVFIPGSQDGFYVDLVDGKFILDHVEESHSRTVLADRRDFIDSKGRQIVFRDWKISPDLQYLSLSGNIQTGWRHSFFADYWIYNISSKVTKSLNNTQSDKFIANEKGSGKIAFAQWSPEGGSMAWVRDNDLFVSVDGTETRITTDGSKDTINGIADWVYEEEVLSQQKASWFSPDAKIIAFIKFNETLVSDYQLQYYAKYGESQYPKMIDVKYPKPGTHNPTVQFYISDISSVGSSAPFLVDFGKDGFKAEDMLITEVTWMTRNDSLLIRIMNRVQDIQKLYLITKSESKWISTLVRDEKTPDGAWHNRQQPLTLIPNLERNESHYIEIMDNAAGYAHLALFESPNAVKPTSWITSGKWEVAEVKGVDSVSEKIYYTSTEIGSSQRHLYSVRFDGREKTLLTSENPAERSVSQLEGSIGLDENAGYYNAQFSVGCQYYAVAYLGPDLPWERLEKINTRNTTFNISVFWFLYERNLVHGCRFAQEICCTLF